MTLRECKANDQAEVLAINAHGALKRRIMDMGITKGCHLTVRKAAPLGDPVQITLRGYELTIRKSEGELIEVRLLGGQA